VFSKASTPEMCESASRPVPRTRRGVSPSGGDLLIRLVRSTTSPSQEKKSKKLSSSGGVEGGAIVEERPLYLEFVFGFISNDVESAVTLTCQASGCV